MNYRPRGARGGPRALRGLRRARALLATTALVLPATALVAQTASITPLPPPAGSTNGTSGQAVSADGSVVVGYVQGNDHRAFRWTATDGSVDLGTLGGVSATASGVSADGLIVVGRSQTNLVAPDGQIPGHAFRWTAGTGMVDLGTLGGTHSSANAISANGGVIVGDAQTSTSTRAFRWTSAGMVNLGTIGNKGGFSAAYGVNGDGSVVVGESENGTRPHAFRWTQSGGMVDLGVLVTSSLDSSRANAVSGDGLVVAGQSSIGNTSQSHAFRWTAATGMVDLGTIAGRNSQAYVANAVNATGSIIVGTSFAAFGSGDTTSLAFRWTEATGLRDFNVLMHD
ncbi:MAG: hypothetical protein JWL76_2460, partial [Thermoleophilia bacterium]|nr:hypothetical protein [Thermoleophilia bacterium]